MSNLELKPEVIAKLRKIVLSGKRLDELANFHGIDRKRRFWIFKESDKDLLNRVIAKVKDVK